MKKNKKLHEWLLTLPSLGWLIIFFLVPTIIVFLIAFKPVDMYGGVGKGWTLDTIKSMRDPDYPEIIWRTIWLSCVATMVCILLAIPTGYFLARLNKRWQNILLMLIIVPFWTNFLVRIFAWKVLLHPEGVVKDILVFFHLTTSDTILLYNPPSVLMVIIYTYLPFAILPIYAAAEKFDFRLFEAAMDLGANRFQAFMKVFIPGIKRGLITATVMVFIPALGAYAIPDIVGGKDAYMIGNKIAQRAFVDRNLPHASALSAILTLAVFLPMVVVLIVRSWRDRQIEKLERGI